MKARRQQKILDIIEQDAVETQEDLADRLRGFGFNSTQATISRDIKELRLVKAMGDGGQYRYAVAGVSEGLFLGRLRTIFRESVSSCEAAQNIVVLKTLSGLAPAACSALDSMKIAGVVGTLAGDDTAILILKDNKAAEDLIAVIQEILS